MVLLQPTHIHTIYMQTGSTYINHPCIPNLYTNNTRVALRMVYQRVIRSRFCAVMLLLEECRKVDGGALVILLGVINLPSMELMSPTISFSWFGTNVSLARDTSCPPLLLWFMCFRRGGLAVVYTYGIGVVVTATFGIHNSVNCKMKHMEVYDGGNVGYGI